MIEDIDFILDEKQHKKDMLTWYKELLKELDQMQEVIESNVFTHIFFDYLYLITCVEQQFYKFHGLKLKISIPKIYIDKLLIHIPPETADEMREYIIKFLESNKSGFDPKMPFNEFRNQFIKKNTNHAFTKPK